MNYILIGPTLTQSLVLLEVVFRAQHGLMYAAVCGALF